MAGSEELLPNALVGGLAQSFRFLRVLQQTGHRPAERRQILGIIHQQPTPAVVDLVLDSSHPAGDDGSALPHRLGHRETEPFLQALLDDDVGPPLERVHDGTVLLFVLHRERGQVDPLSDVVGQAGHRLGHFAEDLLSFGIVRHPGRGRTGQDELGLRPTVDMLGESMQDADRVLETIPARHLNDEGRVKARRWTSILHIAMAINSSRRAVEPTEAPRCRPVRLTHNQAYLQFAEMAYSWVRRCLLQANGLFADHIGPKGAVDLTALFSKQLSILGSYMGTKGDLLAAARQFFDGRLRPVIDRTYPLAEARAAQERLEASGQFGKIVLEV